MDHFAPDTDDAQLMLTPLEILSSNLLSVPVLCFALGVVSVLIRSDLKIPPPMYTALAIYLLLAIGLKGGVALSETNPAELIGPVIACLALGLLVPVWIYAAARNLGGLSPANAGGLAAHYGSVSAVTYLACQAVLDQGGHYYEGFMPAMMAVLEVPAILAGLVLARRGIAKLDPDPSGKSGIAWRPMIKEVLSGYSIVLLGGGLVIGYLAGADRAASVSPFFVEPFMGILALFMIEMGTLAARRLSALRKTGKFVLILGVSAAVINGSIGAVIGTAIGLSPGGSALLATLAGSASYVAATAACRAALPEADPGLYLGASLGVTFPFNLAVGIPWYIWLSNSLGGSIGV